MKKANLFPVEHFGLFIDHFEASMRKDEKKGNDLSFKRSSELLRQALANGSHVLIVGYSHARDVEHHAAQLKANGVVVKVKYVLCNDSSVRSELKSRSAFLEKLPSELDKFRDGFGIKPIEPHRIRSFS